MFGILIFSGHFLLHQDFKVFPKALCITFKVPKRPFQTSSTKDPSSALLWTLSHSLPHMTKHQPLTKPVTTWPAPELQVPCKLVALFGTPSPRFGGTCLFANVSCLWYRGFLSFCWELSPRSLDCFRRSDVEVDLWEIIEAKDRGRSKSVRENVESCMILCGESGMRIRMSGDGRLFKVEDVERRNRRRGGG